MHAIHWTIVLVGCMVVGRAVRGAVRQFHPGMLFEVRSDLAGVVNAVVIADHHDHPGPRERPEHLVQQGDEPAGQRRPSPVHPRPGARRDHPQHGDLAARARGEDPGRRPRSVQLACTCGRFRCVSSSASITAPRDSPASRAAMPVTTWSCAGSLRAVGPDAVAEYAAHLRRPGHLAASYAYFRTFHRDVEDTIRNRGTPLAMPVLAVGGKGALGQAIPDQAQLCGDDVTGTVHPCGHWSAEESPELLLA